MTDEMTRGQKIYCLIALVAFLAVGVFFALSPFAQAKKEAEREMARQWLIETQARFAFDWDPAAQKEVMDKYHFTFDDLKAGNAADDGSETLQMLKDRNPVVKALLGY